MNGEQEALVTSNLGLARHLSGRYASLGDDAFSEACVGLVKAALAFDGRGNFGGYASMRINGALLDEVRRLKPGSRQGVEPIVCSFEGTEVVVDLDPLPDQQCEQDDIKRRVLEAMSHLEGRDATVISCLHLQGLSKVQVSQQLNIHPSRVAQLEKRALGILRKQLSDFAEVA